MDEILNPFSPGAGSRPPALVGRDSLIRETEVLLARVKSGRAAKSMIMTGLRGVGKTVLLNRLASEAREQNYHVLMIEVDESQSFLKHLVQSLKLMLLELDAESRMKSTARKALSILKSFAGVTIGYGDFSFGLDISPSQGMADTGSLELDLPALFSTIGEVAIEKGTGIALIVDEVQFLNEQELSALILTMHKMQQLQLPVVLISAGLPVMYELAGQAKSYAERLFSFPSLGPLNREDADKAIQLPIEQAGEKIEPEALETIYRMTQGYPYFLQEWGYWAWNIAQSSPITSEDVCTAGPIVIRQLDDNFFKVRFNRITPKEREFLRAMATLGAGPHRSSDVAERLGKKVSAIGPMRKSLIKKGMIYSPAYGLLDFTVPLFGDFMLRIMGNETSLDSE